MPQPQKSYQQLADELVRAQQKIAQLEATRQHESETQQRAELLSAIKRVDQARQESERRFGAIVQHSSDVTVLLDANGIVRYVSPAIEWTLGYTPKSFVGKDPFAYLHPDDLPRVRATIEKVIQQPGKPTCVDFRLKHADDHWISFEAVTNNLLDTPEGSLY